MERAVLERYSSLRAWHCCRNTSVSSKIINEINVSVPVLLAAVDAHSVTEPTTCLTDCFMIWVMSRSPFFSFVNPSFSYIKSGELHVHVSCLVR